MPVDQICFNLSPSISSETQLTLLRPPSGPISDALPVLDTDQRSDGDSDIRESLSSPFFIYAQADTVVASCDIIYGQAASL